jgi:LacI family fructose operon transcriptional repressor
VNLSDIAKLAGVSKATVSSVLNGKAAKYRISQKTQDKVLKVVQENHYQPNHSAASLRSGKSFSIGLIVPDFENRSYLRIAKRLEALARKKGYQLIIASSDDDPATELESAQKLVSRGIDALMVSTCVTDAGHYETIQHQGVPVIALDRALPDCFSNVISDDFDGGLQLTRALPLAQLSSITFIGAMPELSISKERERGFTAAVSGIGGLKSYLYYGSHFNPDSGKALLRRAFQEQGALPPAIVTTSYALLEGVISELQNEFGPGLNRLEPIHLATFGDSRLLDFLPIPVVSLPQQYEKIAETAWHITEQAIENSCLPQRCIIKRNLNNRPETQAGS